MKIKPDEIPEGVGFSPDNDMFGYKDFGDRLERLISKLDHPSTLVLDGAWGSGKSTFVRQWCHELSLKNQQFILFDAFQNDFHEDAFMPLAAHLLDLKNEVKPSASQLTEKVKKGAKKVGATLLPLATKMSVRALTAGMVDSEDIKDGLSSISETFSQGLSDLAEEIAGDAIDRAMQSQSVLSSFRKDLTELIEFYQKNNNGKPILFIIDELDRCKPTFSLNMIERIKHIFSIPGVVFLLVTNLRQMEATVCGAYGERTDAATYLEKFYDLRVVLPENVRNGKVESYLKHLSRQMELDDDSISMHVEKMILEVSELKKFNLRTVEKIYSNLVINISCLKPNHLKLAPLVAGLCIFRHANPEIYEKCKRKEIVWSEVEGFFEFGKWQDSYAAEWCGGWWRYLTDKDLDRKEDWVRQYSRSLVQYDISDPVSLISWGAGVIDSFDIPE